jgi:hypothetical protein
MKEEKLHRSPGTRCEVKVDGKGDGVDEVGGGRLVSEASVKEFESSLGIGERLDPIRGALQPHHQRDSSQVNLSPNIIHLQPRT